MDGIGFPKQAQFHARKYCLGLSRTLQKDAIYEHSKVTEIKKTSDGYKIICENGYEVNSKYVTIASHYPIINFPGFYFLKMYQDKSYIIAVDTKTDTFPGMYITSKSPVISFRSIGVNDKRILLVGGSGHKTGDTSVEITSCYNNLENYVRSLYPKAKVLYRWSTEDCVTIDKLPYIGNFSLLYPNVYVATGFKKWGMTTSFVAANTIFHEIVGKPLEESKIYKATRFSPFKNRNETANMLRQTGYSLFINKAKPSMFSYEDLKPGEGGIVNYNGKKLAVYRKSESETFAFRPYCKHLGCELVWNPLEKTWDCPCHGSRYDSYGKLITEPSKKDLEYVKI